MGSITSQPDDKTPRQWTEYLTRVRKTYVPRKAPDKDIEPSINDQVDFYDRERDLDFLVSQ